MTEEKQKRIFAKNLNRYINLSRKQQKDVANDLGINPSTLNMWCKGNSMPSTGKIRRLADYFGVGMTDLTDDKSTSEIDGLFSSACLNIGLNDERFKNIIIKYNELPKEHKELFCDFFEKFISFK